MVSAETLVDYIDYTIPLTVNIFLSDKYMNYVNIRDKNQSYFLGNKLSTAQ